MSTANPRFHRLFFGLFLTVLAFTLITGCSDDDPVGVGPASDIQGVVRTEDGRAAPGATVFLGIEPDFLPLAATMVIDSVIADDKGRYEFDELGGGTFRVYAGVWGRSGDGFSWVSPFSDPLGVAAKSAGHYANLALQELVSEGVVLGEAFYYKDQFLTPADSTTVRLYRYQGSELVLSAETTTNADGVFARMDVMTGNYTVTAVKIMDIEAPFPLYLSAESESFFCDGEDVFRVERMVLQDIMVEKPAVYIYPEQPGRFQVGLDFGPAAHLTASEPDYGDGWDVFVDRTGRIDATWDYLFYELALAGVPLIGEGWCISWSGLSAGLESLTVAVGLNAAERDDFLDYWLARLPREEFFVIQPVFGRDLDPWVKLEVTPEPESVLRFWLFFRGSDTEVDLIAPQIPTIVRTGTTVVEWGGAITP